jgi:hypothetical protein
LEGERFDDSGLTLEECDHLVERGLFELEQRRPKRLPSALCDELGGIRDGLAGPFLAQGSQAQPLVEKIRNGGAEFFQRPEVVLSEADQDFHVRRGRRRLGVARLAQAGSFRRDPGGECSQFACERVAERPVANSEHLLELVEHKHGRQQKIVAPYQRGRKQFPDSLRSKFGNLQLLGPAGLPDRTGDRVHRAFVLFIETNHHRQERLLPQARKQRGLEQRGLAKPRLCELQQNRHAENPQVELLALPVAAEETLLVLRGLRERAGSRISAASRSAAHGDRQYLVHAALGWRASFFCRFAQSSIID